MSEGRQASPGARLRAWCAVVHGARRAALLVIVTRSAGHRARKRGAQRAASTTAVPWTWRSHTGDAGSRASVASVARLAATAGSEARAPRFSES